MRYSIEKDDNISINHRRHYAPFQIHVHDQLSLADPVSKKFSTSIHILQHQICWLCDSVLPTRRQRVVQITPLPTRIQVEVCSKHFHWEPSRRSLNMLKNIF